MRFVSKATRQLDSGLTWLGAYSVLTGLVSWLAKHATWLGAINWAEAILIGVFGSAFLGLAVTAALALYRVFRPLKAEAPDHDDLSSGLSHAEAERLAQVFDEGAIERVADARISLALTAYFERLIELERLTSTHELKIAAVDHHSGQTLDLSAQLFAKVDDKFEKLRDFVQYHLRLSESRFEWIDSGFFALQNREWLAKQFANLVERRDILSEDISLGQKIADWNQWNVREKGWRNDLDGWLTIAEFYAQGVLGDVKSIPESIYYSSDWSFSSDRFEHADHVRRYKEFRIISQNLIDQYQRVINAVSHAAFVKPSKRGPWPGPAPILQVD